MLEPRLVINQCYILQECLGEDSFCEIWRATSIYSATQFLLRFLKEGQGLSEKLGEFRDAAMACYSIAAPAVQDFVEVEHLGERAFIASEYGAQRSLLDFLGHRPQIRLEHSCRYVIELGQGLDAFHKRGLLYRCLTAENVLVRAVEGHVETIRIQKPGYAVFLPLIREGDSRAIMENWGYVAPELKGGALGDRRSDIYSLGVHLFRLIVGKLPYSSAKRARTGSVSLSYVSRAFNRRGVPLPVTRATLKALRKDPKLRHAEVLELIAELRAFVDERRRELIAKGDVDPVDELSRLNLGKDRVDATQAVRSLDTADYFRSMSLAYLTPTPKGPILYFPVDDFLSPKEVERLEEAEADGAEDDGRQDADSFIAEAVEAVRGEEASKRRDGSAVELPSLPAKKPPAALPAEAAAPLPSPEAGKAKAVAKKPSEDEKRPPLVDETAGGKTPPALPEDEEGPGPAVFRDEAETPPEIDLKPEDIHPAPLILVRDEVGEEAPSVGAFASDPAPKRQKKSPVRANVDAGGISWRPASALPEVVVEGMDSAFMRAFKGTGAFRFIQEPQPGPGAVAFARVFARFRARGLVADLGILPKAADTTDLLRLLRQSLAAGLSYETPQARAVLAKRLRSLDSEGALAAAPLGALLFGADGPEADPEWTESMEGALRLATCIAALGRRRRPLVLTMRGGEELGPSAHGLLMELARIAPIASFCCFVFYKPVRVPPWHVLSRLGGEAP